MHTNIHTHRNQHTHTHTHTHAHQHKHTHTHIHIHIHTHPCTHHNKDTKTHWHTHTHTHTNRGYPFSFFSCYLNVHFSKLFIIWKPLQLNCNKKMNENTVISTLIIVSFDFNTQKVRILKICRSIISSQMVIKLIVKK